MSHRFYKAVSLSVAWLLASSLTTSLVAQKASDKRESKKPTKTEFLKLKSDSSGKPLALQTAISRYTARSGKNQVTVDLVGVIHIGDKEYYQKLDKQFKNYDVVLYELVAPEGTVIDKDAVKKNTNPLRMLQAMPQQMLGLASQLENINYKAKNFVHADLTPSEISKKMKERGDSTLTVLLSTAADMIRQQNKQSQKKSATDGGDAMSELSSLFEMMNNPNKMKIVMAKQFVQSGALDAGLGKSLNQILIKDRNEEAMKELNRQMFAGHKKIAIFYGAAHMPDFEKRMKSDYGFKLKNQVWMDAWDLTKKVKAKSSDPSKLLLDMLKDLGG